MKWKNLDKGCFFSVKSDKKKLLQQNQGVESKKKHSQTLCNEHKKSMYFPVLKKYSNFTISVGWGYNFICYFYIYSNEPTKRWTLLCSWTGPGRTSYCLLNGGSPCSSEPVHQLAILSIECSAFFHQVPDF